MRVSNGRTTPQGRAGLGVAAAAVGLGLAASLLGACAGGSATERTSGDRETSTREREAPDVATLRVSKPRIVPAAGDEPPRVYFVLVAGGEPARRLVGASSPCCDAVELRRTAVVAGQWDSVAMPEGFELPPIGMVAFAPRGLFLRLVGAPALAPGERVPIELALDGGDTLAFDTLAFDAVVEAE